MVTTSSSPSWRRSLDHDRVHGRGRQRESGRTPHQVEDDDGPNPAAACDEDGEDVAGTVTSRSHSLVDAVPDPDRAEDTDEHAVMQPQAHRRVPRDERRDRKRERLSDRRGVACPHPAQPGRHPRVPGVDVREQGC